MSITEMIPTFRVHCFSTSTCQFTSSRGIYISSRSLDDDDDDDDDVNDWKTTIIDYLEFNPQCIGRGRKSVMIAVHR